MPPCHGSALRAPVPIRACVSRLANVCSRVCFALSLRTRWNLCGARVYHMRQITPLQQNDRFLTMCQISVCVTCRYRSLCPVSPQDIGQAVRCPLQVTVSSLGDTSGVRSICAEGRGQNLFWLKRSYRSKSKKQMNFGSEANAKNKWAPNFSGPISFVEHIGSASLDGPRSFHAVHVPPHVPKGRRAHSAHNSSCLG